jgi:hypothetical protein
MGMSNQYAKWVQSVLTTALSASMLLAGIGCQVYGAREEYMALRQNSTLPTGWPVDENNKPLPRDKNGAPLFPKSYSAEKIEQVMEKFCAAQNWDAAALEKNFPSINLEIATRRVASRSSH